MIVGIEGPSAAGKTTWCRSHCANGFVEGAAENIAAPDPYSDPKEVAHFWVNFGAQLWQSALRIEAAQGIAICDGDPLHLYYSWALWKSGALASTLFEIESKLYRQAIAEKRLGFADLIFWLDVPTQELRRRAQADSTRRRRRHEMNLSCVPWMRAWFEARERLLPGTVCALTLTFHAEDLPRSSAMPQRYDPVMMDRITELLQRPGLTTGQESA